MDRRRRYLLRENVPFPLSVDPAVWPKARDEQGAAVVLVTACGRGDENVARWLGIPVFETFCQSQEWTFLGYDVCDQTLVSGLLNCGYATDSEKLAFSSWAALLNNWHLFDEASDAESFAKATDARIPAHSPFHVFGLYTTSPVEPVNGPQL